MDGQPGGQAGAAGGQITADLLAAFAMGTAAEVQLGLGQNDWGDGDDDDDDSEHRRPHLAECLLRMLSLLSMPIMLSLQRLTRMPA